MGLLEYFLSPYQSAIKAPQVFWTMLTGTNQAKANTLLGLTKVAGANPQGVQYAQQQWNIAINKLPPEEQKRWYTPYFANTDVQVPDVGKTINDTFGKATEGLFNLFGNVGQWAIVIILIVVLFMVMGKGD